MASRKTSIIKNMTSVEDVFLRETEKNEIKKFPNSKSKILHIAGSPGNGKTVTVKYVLKDQKYFYINYLTDNKIPVITDKIIVFDEFDKFYNNKRSECLNFLQEYSHKKIITISNDLLFNKNNLVFKPYDKNEIIQIVKKKMTSDRIDDILINVVALKETNDLRKVLNTFNSLLTEKQDNITLKDLNNTQKRRPSIHQQIISEIKQENTEKRQAFKNYIGKCKTLKISELNRIDFYSIFENIE
ncbi:hypothetical protein M153_34630001341 [Pseudoloma neurophilia]|uniref:Uncharacterized protein n=1 Tax=Pseudoloma neurophilia TaxID=146866 RepID=A0A0R0LXT2_9MICR|nr:hypothetical protein M153_34630001341 [Pseudoloma neurophilia]